MNNARYRILQNLRKSSTTPPASSLPRHQDISLYRNYDAARQHPLQIFAQKLAALKGEFFHVVDATAAAKILRELLSEFFSTSEVAGGGARHRHPLLDRVVAADPWLNENIQIIDRQKISSPDFANFLVGITAVDFLVARTGSLILSTATAGGRRLSVLPPFHIAIATPAQIVVSLEEALQQYHARGESKRSSYATVITGPSRTSDIEKILVLGAHGPKRLAVIVVEEKATAKEAHLSQ